MMFSLSIVIPQDDNYIQSTVQEFMDHIADTDYKFCERFEIKDNVGDDELLPNVIVFGDTPDGRYLINRVKISERHPLYNHPINNIMRQITDSHVFTDIPFYPMCRPKVVRMICWDR